MLMQSLPRGPQCCRDGWHATISAVAAASPGSVSLPNRMFASLLLTTPFLLGGLALLALPLIAHWMHRQSHRTIVFPSITLLLAAVAQQSRFHRLKRWILLALRLVAVACIVVAFTRPVWQERSADAAIDPEASVALVVIVDASASTGQATSGMTELEAFKAAAGRAFNELQRGVDQAGVVVANASSRSLFPRLTANLDGLRSELARITPSAERADFPAAFQAAGRLLAGHSGPKRVAILSDLQRTNWSDLQAADRLREAFPPGTHVTVLPREGEPAGNVALSRPRCFPAAPLPGEPVDVTIQVANQSISTRQVSVVCERLRVDQPDMLLGRDELTLTLTAGERRDLTFEIPELDPEQQVVQFAVRVDDALAIDNRAWLTVSTAVATPVLLLSDDDPQEPGTAGYYLQRALLPETNSTGRFSLVQRRSTELTAEALQGMQVVVAGYLGFLRPEQAQLLTDFVHSGGALIVFAGGGPVDRNLTALETASQGGMLPWRPTSRRVTLPARDPWRLRGGRWQSRWLRTFDEQSQVAIQQIQFTQVWGAGPLAADAEVLLTFEDESPALGGRAFGRGTFVLANFSPDAASSDLARHGAFVALTQMIVQAASTEEGVHSECLAGMPCTFRERLPLDAAAALTVQGPDGVPAQLSTRPEDDHLVATVTRSSQPGVYRLFRDGKPIAALAVALDEREGDLARLSAAEVERSLQVLGEGVAIEPLSRSNDSPLRGRPLWGAFLTASLCAIGLELFLLGLWRR